MGRASKYEDQSKINYFYRSLDIISKNLKSLIELNNSLSANESNAEYSLDQNFSIYKRNIFENNLNDFKVFTYIKNEESNFLLKLDEFNSEKYLLINQNELADIISTNKLKDNRVELIPFKVNYLKEEYKTIKFEGGEILYSAKTNININNSNKTILIDQYDPSNWVLFKEMNLKNWIIKLQGQSTKPGY